MKAVTDLDPTMTHSNPIVADDTPLTMDVLEQPTQAVLRLQPVQPMTAPLPLAVFPPVMTSPAPLLTTVVAMTLPDPLMADRNPLRTHVFPPAVSIAVKNSTTVQGSQSPQPIATPMVLAPSPLKPTPSMLVTAIGHGDCEPCTVAELSTAAGMADGERSPHSG